MRNAASLVFNRAMLAGTRQDRGELVWKTWILVADSERLRILELSHPDGMPQEIDVIERVEAAAQADADGGARGFGEQDALSTERVFLDANPALVEFMEIISGRLEGARQTGRFDRLIMIASKGMLSLLSDSLTTDVRNALALEIEADLMDADAGVIRATLPL